MAGLNKVMIIGNLGADPEMSYTPSGAAKTTFRVACSRSWTNRESGERQEHTEWVQVVTWNRLAEICSQYLSKGRSVYVEGRLQTRRWEDQQGQTRYMTEVVAMEVQFLGGRGEGGGEFGGGGYGGGGGGGNWQGGGPPAGGPVDADDLPFE